MHFTKTSAVVSPRGVCLCTVVALVIAGCESPPPSAPDERADSYDASELDAGPDAEPQGGADERDGEVPPDGSDANTDDLTVPQCEERDERDDLAAYRRLSARIGAAKAMLESRCGVFASADALAKSLRFQHEVACQSALPVGLSEGRVRFDAEAAERCVARLNESNCQEPFEAVCDDLLIAGVEPDGACTNGEHEQCTRGFYCDLTTSCPGRCVPRAPLGEAAGDGECVEGASQSRSGVCRAMLVEGAACSLLRDTPDCVEGTHCDEPESGLEYGTCVRPAYRAAGESCKRPLIEICEVGTYCDDHHVCRPLAALGQPCTSTTYGCQRDLFCANGSCRAPGGAGEPCSFRSDCSDPLVCRRTETSGAGFACAPAAALGEACENLPMEECQPSLYCSLVEPHRCTEAKSQGEDCTTNGDE